jgi:type IV pilus assembly protein PilN
MTLINLLPWRENRRKRQQREFGFMLGGGVVCSLLLMLGSHLWIAGSIDNQNQRNRLLKKEIAALDKKIEEIKDLEKTKASLLARMEVIQQLQSSRPQIVHLFDELVTTLPDGLFLTKVQQAGAGLSMDGRAQSNARVSAYMRNIDASEWLARPRLKLIEHKDKTGTGLSHFSLGATQVAQVKE